MALNKKLGLADLHMVIEPKSPLSEVVGAIEELHAGTITQEEFDTKTQPDEVPPPNDYIERTVDEAQAVIDKKGRILPALNQDEEHTDLMDEPILTPDELKINMTEEIIRQAGYRAMAQIRGQKHVQQILQNYSQVCESILVLGERVGLKVRIGSNHPDAVEGILEVKSSTKLTSFSPRDLLTIGVYLATEYEELKNRLATEMGKNDAHVKAAQNRLAELQDLNDKLAVGEALVQREVNRLMAAHEVEFATEMNTLRENATKKLGRFYTTDDKPYVILNTVLGNKYLKITGNNERPKSGDFSTVRTLAEATKFASLGKARAVLERLDLLKKKVSVKNTNRYAIGKVSLVVIETENKS